MAPQFKAGGVVTQGYIVRDADNLAARRLRNGMEPFMIIEPRQQGKTSLILHLRDELPELLFLYIDAMDLNTTSEAGWYATLHAHIADCIEMDIRKSGVQWDCPAVPDSPHCWSMFFPKLARSAPRPVVLVLDEVGAITFPGAESFFKVLRSLCQKRAFETDLSRLISLVLVGAFEPDDLIRNKNLSPFNCAEPISLGDFSRDEVERLVRLGPWPDAGVPAISERIFYWTAGQPYLTQLLCSYLQLDLAANESSVDAAVDRAIREDKNHFPRLFHRLKGSIALQEGLDAIRKPPGVVFAPYQRPELAALQLLGLMKIEKRYCVIRNPMYERAFRDPPQSGYDIFLSYRNDSGSELAHLIYRELARDWNVYLDLNNELRGRLDEELLAIIERTATFVPILTPGALDDCVPNGGPWMCAEISHAYKTKRRVVPIVKSGFDYPSNLPDNVAAIRFEPAIHYESRYLEAFLASLRARLEDGAVAAAKA